MWSKPFRSGRPSSSMPSRTSLLAEESLPVSGKDRRIVQPQRGIAASLSSSRTATAAAGDHIPRGASASQVSCGGRIGEAKSDKLLRAQGNPISDKELDVTWTRPTGLTVGALVPDHAIFTHPLGDAGPRGPARLAAAHAVGRSQRFLSRRFCANHGPPGHRRQCCGGIPPEMFPFAFDIE